MRVHDYPNCIRVFFDGDGWGIDGIDAKTGKFTETVWVFESREDASSAHDLFLDYLELQGVDESSIDSYTSGIWKEDPRPGDSTRTKKRLVLTVQDA